MNLLRQLPSGREDEGLALGFRGVYLLQYGDREGRGFARPGLRLRDDVQTLDARNDRALLDRGRLLEAIGVDAAQQLLAQGHVVEVLANLQKKKRGAQNSVTRDRKARLQLEVD